MSRHTITDGDHHWTLGYDDAMATYYARREPAYWPAPVPLPTLANSANDTTDAADRRTARAANEALLRDLTDNHEREMTLAYGPDWPARLHTNPTLQAVTRRHHELVLTVDTAATGQPPPRFAGRTDDLDPDDPIATVLGVTYGEIRSLEELQARLRADHQLDLDPNTWRQLDLERRSHLTHADHHADHHPDTPAPPRFSGPGTALLEEARTAIRLASAAQQAATPSESRSTSPPRTGTAGRPATRR